MLWINRNITDRKRVLDELPLAGKLLIYIYSLLDNIFYWGKCHFTLKTKMDNSIKIENKI